MRAASGAALPSETAKADRFNPPLPASAVDMLLRCKELQPARARLFAAEYLLEMHERRLFRQLGYSSVMHYGAHALGPVPGMSGIGCGWPGRLGSCRGWLRLCEEGGCHGRSCGRSSGWQRRKRSGNGWNGRAECPVKSAEGSGGIRRRGECQCGCWSTDPLSSLKSMTRRRSGSLSGVPTWEVG